MNIEEFRNYCLSKPFATECFPFDETTLVFKIGEKMFALCSLDSNPVWANIKATPEHVQERCESFAHVKPGYHMNKRYWITVPLDGMISQNTIEAWVDESYNLVFESLTKKVKESLLFNDE